MSNAFIYKGQPEIDRLNSISGRLIGASATLGTVGVAFIAGAVRTGLTELSASPETQTNVDHFIGTGYCTFLGLAALSAAYAVLIRSNLHKERALILESEKESKLRNI